MADYGLLSGLGEGLKQGLLMYQNQKQLNRQNQIQALTSGVQTDENGNMQLTPQKQAQQNYQQAQAKHGMDNEDPTTTVSQSKRETAKGLLNAQQPGLGDQTIKDQMSGADVDQLGTLIKPTIMGGYNVAAAKEKGSATTGAAQIGAGAKVQAAQIGADAQKSRQQMMAGRLEQGDERIHNQNLDKVNKDPMASSLITTTNNLQNAVSNYQKGGSTPQEFQELQQAVRSNLGIKGTSGVDERSETYLNSLGIKKDKLVQFLTGDPQSTMDSDPELANQVMKVANLEMENKKKQYADQVNKLTAGHSSFYAKHPELKQDYFSAVQGGQQQMGIQGQPQQGLVGGGQAQRQGLVQGAPSVDPKIDQYAKQNGLDYSHAQAILVQRGYKPNGQ